MQCVDERLVEALDVVVVWRADDRGEVRLGLREEIFCVLRGIHGSDGEVDVPTARAAFRWRGRRRGSAVVIVGTDQW